VEEVVLQIHKYQRGCSRFQTSDFEG
jgi:hypothetical protein